MSSSRDSLRAIVGPWAAVPLELLQDRHVTRNMIRVYGAIAYHQGSNSSAWPSVETIAKNSGVSRGHVSENIAQLQRLGWLIVHRRFGQSTVYRCAHPVDELVPVSPETGKTGDCLTFPGDWDDSFPDARGDSLPRNRGTKTPTEDTTEDTQCSLPIHEQANGVIDYLNEKCHRSFHHTENSRKHIVARLREGLTVEELHCVVDSKSAAWANDAKMSEYLRPATLFGPNCESYLQAATSDGLAGLDLVDDDEKPLEGRVAE